MLSASILGYSLFHSLGDAETFFTKLDNKDENSLYLDLLEPNLSSLSTLLPKANMRRVPKYAKLGLLSAVPALQNAGFSTNQSITQNNVESEEKSFVAKNMGLVIGTSFSSSQMNVDFMESILDSSPELSSPTAFSHAVNNMGAGLISLILKIQGGCQTVTQFDHSFAGAIQTALLLLASGKNDYVLVGGLDEIDSRFSFTCRNHLQKSPYALSEGSVFLLLGKNTEETKTMPKISVSFTKENCADILTQHNDTNIYLSGFSTDELSTLEKNSGKSISSNTAFYGTTPLAQAFDTAIALKSQTKKSICICKEENSNQLAIVHLFTYTQ